MTSTQQLNNELCETSEQKKRPFFAYIQVLRGIAAFMVLVGHSWHEASTEWGAGSFAYPFGAGVHIFFVISGFVIAYNSPHLCGMGSEGIRTFLWRRSIRIIPLYWFYTSLMVLALFLFPQAIGSSKFEIWHVIQSYLFIPHLDPNGTVYPVLSLGWTLNYEMYFYVVFAALMFLPYRMLLWALSAFFGGTVILGLTIIPDYVIALKFWFAPIVLEFLAGAWIGYAKVKQLEWPRWSLWPLCGVGIVCLLLLYFVSPGNYLPIMVLAGTALVAAATLPNGMDHESAPFALRAMGDSSYTLYLSHAFVIGIMTLLWGRIFFQIFDPYTYMIITILGAVLAAYVAYLFIEKPILSFMKKSRK